MVCCWTPAVARLSSAQQLRGTACRLWEGLRYRQHCLPIVCQNLMVMGVVVVA
jgi:hypothetical protein